MKIGQFVSAPEKVILDACCGGRMMWFDKTHSRVLYVDIREVPPGCVPARPNFCVRPDVVADFRDLPFPDRTFKIVVWDPPHQIGLHARSWVRTKYGSLDPETWAGDLQRGFSECWRVLDDYGVLVFKWSVAKDGRPNRDVPLKAVLDLFPVRPLFGNPPRSRVNTSWLHFVKFPEVGPRE